MHVWKKKNYPLSHQILMGTGAVVVLLLIIYLLTAGQTEIHSDSAAPLINALEMFRTGDIIPEGWHGSTGIMIFRFPIWFFLLFTSDYLLAKACAQVLWLLIMLLSVIFMSKHFFRNNSWTVIVPFLCTCISLKLRYEMLYLQCGYTFVVFAMFYGLGTLGWAIPDVSTWKWKRKRILVLLAVVFLSCLTGIVLVQALLLPTVGAIIFLTIQEHQGIDQRTEAKKLIAPCTLACSIFVVGALGYLGSKMLFYLGNIGGNSEATTIVHSISQITKNLVMIWEAIFFYVDVPPGVSLFSIAGIFAILRFVVFLTITLIFPILMWKNYYKQDRQTQFLFIFSLIHLAESVLVILFTTMVDYTGVARYLLTSFTLLHVVSAQYIYVNYISKINLLGFIYSFAIGGGALLLMIPVIQLIPSYQVTLTQMRDLTAFLEKNNLSYGYSTFWHAGNNTVLSNGSVQINAILLNEGKVIPYYWLSSEDWYDPDFYQGDTFLMLSSTELAAYAPDGLEETVLGIPDQQLTYGDFTILVYDHNISQNGFSGIVDGSIDYTDGYMVVSDTTMLQEDTSILIQPGQLMYGPYINLEDGKYELTVVAQMQGSQTLNVTANSGGEEIISVSLEDGTNVISFTLVSSKQQVEFVVHNTESEAIIIDTITLKQLS